MTFSGPAFPLSLGCLHMCWLHSWRRVVVVCGVHASCGIQGRPWWFWAATISLATAVQTELLFPVIAPGDLEGIH